VNCSLKSGAEREAGKDNTANQSRDLKADEEPVVTDDEADEYGDPDASPKSAQPLERKPSHGCQSDEECSSCAGDEDLSEHETPDDLEPEPEPLGEVPSRPWMDRSRAC